MHGEFENPERRYRGFRPRQAYTSALAVSAPASHAIHSLYNNSSGSQWIVLRRIVAQSVSSPQGRLFQGTRGSNSGAVTPITANEAIGPGQHFYLDGALGVATYLFNVPGTTGALWTHDFPACVLPPGWSFGLEDPTSTEAMAVSFFWEAVFAEELDYPW